MSLEHRTVVAAVGRPAEPRRAVARKSGRPLGGLVAAAVVALGSVAATQPPKMVEPVYPPTDLARIDRQRPVLVAPPKVTVRAYKVARRERRVELPIESIAGWVRQTEVTTLLERGFSVVAGESEADGGLSELAQTAEHLIRGAPLPAEAADALGAACAERPEASVLAQHLRIKAAPGGAWDPVSGTSSLDMSNSTLRVTLLDCETRARLWDGEMYIRMIPVVGDQRFEAAVAGIFGSLEWEES